MGDSRNAISYFFVNAMTDKKICELGYKFIDKLNYKFIYKQRCRVDHINKIVCVENTHNSINVLAACLAILYWNTPICFCNFFKEAYLRETQEEINIYSFADYLVDVLENITELHHYHRNKDIYTLFHPWINRDLVNDLYNASVILVSKMFDDEDNYFRKENDNNPYTIDVNSLDRKLIDCICNDFNGCITGSVAISYYGTIYRDSFHDIDFLVSTEHLTDEINQILDYEIEHNKIVGKRRIEVENKVKILFERTNIFKTLKSLYNNVQIKACSIDRVSEYDEYVKCTFILLIDGKEYDLIFKSDICRRFIEPLCIFVQEIGDIFYSKTLLGRPKDYKDLINFKPYDAVIFQNSKCITLL